MQFLVDALSSDLVFVWLMFKEFALISFDAHAHQSVDKRNLIRKRKAY